MLFNNQNATEEVLFEIEADSIGFGADKLRFLDLIAHQSCRFLNAAHNFVVTPGLLNEQSVTFDGFTKLLSQELTKLNESLESFKSINPPYGTKVIFNKMVREMTSFCKNAKLALEDYDRGLICSGNRCMNDAAVKNLSNCLRLTSDLTGKLYDEFVVKATKLKST